MNLFGDDEPKRARRRDVMFDALAESWLGSAWESRLTKSAAGMLRAAAKDLRDSGYDAGQVPTLAAEYMRRHPTWEFTPSALAKWAPSLTASVSARERVVDGRRELWMEGQGWIRDWTGAA